MPERRLSSEFPHNIAECDQWLIGSERMAMANDDLRALQADLASIEDYLQKMLLSYLAFVEFLDTTKPNALPRNS